MSGIRFRTIEIKRVTYTLKFNHNAIAAIEEHLGYGVEQVFTKAMGWAGLRVLFWGAMRHKFPAWTLDRAGALLDEYEEEAGSTAPLAKLLIELLQECGVLAKPAPEDEKPESEKLAHEAPSTPTTTPDQSTSATAPTAG